MSQGFAFGEIRNAFAVPDSEGNPDGQVYTVFDTSSNIIELPKHIYADYVDGLFFSAGLLGTGSEATEKGGMVAQCGQYPELHFMFSNTWITVDPKDYVVDISDSQDGSLCQVLIGETDKPFISMGLPMFKGYYTIFSDDRGEMGFATTKNSSKNGPYPGAVPSKDLNVAVPPSARVSGPFVDPDAAAKEAITS